MKAKFNFSLSSDTTAVIPADNTGFALTAGVVSLFLFVLHLCRVTGLLGPWRPSTIVLYNSVK